MAVSRKYVSPREKKNALHPGLSLQVTELDGCGDDDDDDDCAVPEPAQENGVLECLAADNLAAVRCAGEPQMLFSSFVRGPPYTTYGEEDIDSRAWEK